METLSLSFIFVFYIGIRLLLGHHKTQTMKDRKKYQNGIDLVNEKKYQEALLYFEKITKDNPKSGVAWMFKGECYFFLGEFYSCLCCCDKALNIDYNLRDTYIFKGKALYEIGEFKDAFIEFDKAVWHFRENSPESFYFRGLCHFRLGNYDKAEYDFKRAMQLGDEDANFLLHQIKNKTDVF